MPIVAALPAIAGVVGAAGTAAAGVGSAINAFSGGKNKGGETVTAQQMIPGFQAQAGSELSNWVSQYLNNYKPGTPYSGQLTAPMSDLEKKSLSDLTAFSSAPATGDLFGAGKQQILDTLGGKFADPNSSPFIRSMINLSKMNLQDTIDQSRQGAGARGTFFTTPAMQQESTLRQKSQTGLDAVIGQFIQNERQNQLGAAQTAQSMDEYGNVIAPLKKITAEQTLGALPRTIQQADLEAQYQAWLNQNKDLSQVPNVALGLYGTQQPYGLQSVTMPTNNSSGLSGLLSVLGGSNGQGGIGSILSSLFGGSSGGGSNTGRVASSASLLNPDIINWS